MNSYPINTSIRERLERERESEEKQLLAMTNQITPALKEPILAFPTRI